MCPACATADAEITAEAEAARALDDELTKTRAAAAVVRAQHAKIRSRYRGPDDPDYDDPFFWNDSGDQGRPEPGERIKIDPFYHHKSLHPEDNPEAERTTDNQPPTPWRSRMRCSLDILNPPPLSFDGPPPF